MLFSQRDIDIDVAKKGVSCWRCLTLGRKHSWQPVAVVPFSRRGSVIAFIGIFINAVDSDAIRGTDPPQHCRSLKRVRDGGEKTIMMFPSTFSFYARAGSCRPYAIVWKCKGTNARHRWNAFLCISLEKCVPYAFARNNTLIGKYSFAKRERSNRPTRNLSHGPDQVDPNQLSGLYKVMISRGSQFLIGS